MLAEDALGQTREQPGLPLAPGYVAAFAAIQADSNNELVVCVLDTEVLGMLQLSFIPCLSYVGGWRAQIENVRIAAAYRGRGLGRRLFDWAIARAREHGCIMVQLTTDKRRPDAIGFYESLGFRATHEGMKLWLPGTVPGRESATDDPQKG